MSASATAPADAGARALPAGAPGSALWRCFGLYRRHPWWLLASLVLAALANATMPLIQYLVQQAMDAGLAAAGRGAAAATAATWPWILGLAGFALARGVVAWLATVVGMIHGQLILTALRSGLFTAAQALDLDFHRRHGVGELTARTTRDSDVVRDALTSGFRGLIEVALVALGALALLAWYHWLLAAVPALLLIAATLWLLRHARAIEDLNRRTGAAYDRMAQDLEEGVRGVRVIKAFALEERRLARFARHVGVLARRQLAAVAAAAWRLPPPQLLAALGQVWVMACGAWLMARGELSAGGLAATSMAILMIVFRVENIGRILQTFAAAQASAVRVREILDAVPAVVPPAAPLPLPAGPLALRWRGVAKGFVGSAVLDGVDLTVAAGEVVALVGATGSGKSTLAMLAARFADPDRGAVELGAGGTWTDLRRIDLPGLRRGIQVLPQEAFLFSATLGENLRLARPDAAPEAVRAALRAASAEAVVDELPGGLDERVGERGVTVSGGQRQRLCLARALIAEPRILIADDATSALDALTEAEVLGHLRRQGCAMLLVASRLSTVLAADRVALLDGGRIAAVGTHAELVAAHPGYRELLGVEAA